VLVLDNCETISDDSPFPLLLREALDIAPEGTQWYLLGRQDVFSDLAYVVSILGGQKIDERELALTNDEVDCLMPAEWCADKAHAAKFRRLSAGLIATIKPLLALIRAGLVEPPTKPDTSPKASYFACARTMLFALSEPDRQTLVALSLLDRVTPDALEGLASSTKISGLLRSWHRRGMFVERCVEDKQSFRFHPMFREVLRELLAAQWDAPRRLSLIAAVARFCERTGRIVEALRLYQEVGD